MVCFGLPDGSGINPEIKSRYVKWSRAELPPEDEVQEVETRKYKPKYSTNPIRDFLDFCLYETNRDYDQVIHTHNGGRYDMILAAGEAYKIPQLKISMIARGNKIYSMRMQKGKGRVKRVTKTTFHDSFNIIPIRLSKFVTTLDLVNEKDEPLEQKGKNLVF